MEDDPRYKKLFENAKYFEDESDRGWMLLASGLIEELLKELISGFMVEGAPIRELFDGETAPLGTLSARIKLAQALGLISADEAHDLRMVREMRNRFAHRVDTSFEREDIEHRCRALRMLKHSEEPDVSSPGLMFKHAATVFMVALTMRAEGVRQTRRSARDNESVPWKVAS